MALIGTLNLAIELKSPADKLWKAFKDFSNVLPKILPETYKNIEVLQGNAAAMDNDGNGVVTLSKISPCTLVEGAPAMMVEKKKLEVDERNKTIIYSVIDGDIMKFYKSYNVVIAIEPKVAKAKGDDNANANANANANEGGEGSIVTWSVKFEKVNQMVPDPNMSKDMTARTLYILDAHLLYSQYIQVTPQKEHI